MRWIDDISRLTHSRLRGHDESWCSYAYRHQHFLFWRLWVRVWGRDHCQRSWERYHGTIHRN